MMSSAIRHLKRTLWPARMKVQTARNVAVTVVDECCRPARGLPKPVLTAPLYPTLSKRDPASIQVEPPLTLYSTTPPSKSRTFESVRMGEMKKRVRRNQNAIDHGYVRIVKPQKWT